MYLRHELLKYALSEQMADDLAQNEREFTFKIKIADSDKNDINDPTHEWTTTTQQQNYYAVKSSFNCS